MIAALADLWRVFTGAGIALDKAEAADLGAPKGDTISIWCAIEQRHGRLIGHIACLGLYLVQRRHCRKQLAGTPMAAGNYVRAFVLLLLAIPFVFLFWLARKAFFASRRMISLALKRVVRLTT